MSMRKTGALAPVPVRGHVLPWRTDVLPPMNRERYAAKVARVAEGPEYTVDVPDDADVAAPPATVHPLVVAMAEALGRSRGKMRKDIQAGKSWVRDKDGTERQVFDPDYLLVTGETVRLDD